MVGQGLTVLAVGAGGDCSDIFFFSLFSLRLSGTEGCVTCGVSPFQQNCTGWRPVMAVFYYTFISCNRNIVSSDSTSLNK